MRTSCSLLARYVLAAVMLLATGLMLSACGASSKTVKAKLPAGESAANTYTDTLRVEAPELRRMAPAARVALPKEAALFEEELHRPAPFPVNEIEVTREAVTVWTPGARLTYRPPAYGETLRIRRGLARVEGEPKTREVEAEVAASEEKASLFERLAGLPAWASAGLLALLLITILSIIRTLR